MDSRGELNVPEGDGVNRPGQRPRNQYNNPIPTLKKSANPALFLLSAQPARLQFFPLLFLVVLELARQRFNGDVVH